MKAIGWLLDCYIRNDTKSVVLWIKREDGLVLRLTDSFSVPLYIEPRGKESALDIHSILERATGIKSLQWVEKKVLTSNSRRKRIQLLECRFETPRCFYVTTKILQRNPLVKDLYDVDLLPIQLYLYTQLQIEPTSKIEVEYDADDHLMKMTQLDGDAREIAPPPLLSSLYFDIHPLAPSLTPIPQRDPIQSIEVNPADINY